jgi:hypothetical protein
MAACHGPIVLSGSETTCVTPASARNAATCAPVKGPVLMRRKLRLGRPTGHGSTVNSRAVSARYAST